MTGTGASPTPGQRKDTGMKQPPDRDASHPSGTRPPEYVVVTWVSEQMRDRIQRNGKSLAEALQAKEAQNRAAEPDLEAEP